MKAAVKQNPVVIEINAPKAMKMMTEDPRMVYLTSSFEARAMMRNFCNLRFVLDADRGMTLRTGLFPKNSPYVSRINAAMASMQSQMEFIAVKYMKKVIEGDECANGGKKARFGETPLSLENYFGVIFVCMLAYGLASIMFLIELISARVMKRWERKQNHQWASKRDEVIVEI